MISCPPLCDRVRMKEEERKKKRKRVATLEEGKL